MWNEEIEKAVLFYIIFEGEDYALNEDDFVEYRNKEIIKAINELKAEKKEITMLAIQEKAGEKDSTDFLKYLTNLGEYIRTDTPEFVYDRLIELSKKRKVYMLLDEKMNEVGDCENIDIFIQKMLKEANEIQQINTKESSFLEQVVKTVSDIEAEQQKGINYDMYTGIQDLDDKTFGLHNSEFTIIGARPRNRKNNICITNCRTYCSKRNMCRDCKFRNVRKKFNRENTCKKS